MIKNNVDKIKLKAEEISVEHLSIEEYENAINNTGRRSAGGKRNRDVDWFTALPYESYVRITHPTTYPCDRLDPKEGDKLNYCGYTSTLYSRGKRDQVKVSVIHEIAGKTLLIYKSKKKDS